MSGANATPLGIAGSMSSMAGELPSAGATKMSREEFKRQKVIEEQRKAGTIPAEVDPETGEQIQKINLVESLDINPHIPHYIAEAPWYLDIKHATLKHQRGPEAKVDGINDWYNRGAKDTSVINKKFRKGACENCGAMSHKTRDCLDRPRNSKNAAKTTNKTLSADEITQSVSLGFDAKRDRWNGYDSSAHSKVISDWELVEKERQRIREEKAAAELAEVAAKSAAAESSMSAEDKEARAALLATVFNDDEEVDVDEDKYADAAEQIGQKLDTKSRTTVRNLRIREDTAKYLLNLDKNSAHYDPKTRSMRDNPNKDKDPKDLQYAGDNFVRWTGDAPKMAQLQLFAWQKAGNSQESVHLQANPTMGEILFKEHQKTKEVIAEVKKDSVLARYGGEEHLQAPPKELLLAQTEHYVEYSQTGKIIKGQEKASVKSKYEEDFFPQNHQSVWGSYWNSGRWGYACCHSFIRNSYCTGQAGIDAANSSNLLLKQNSSSSSLIQDSKAKSLYETHVLKAGKDAKKVPQQGKLGTGAVRLGEGDVVIDEEKLKKAIEREEARKRRDLDDDDENDKKKKKKFNSLEDTAAVTEEDLEAYRMARSSFEDPMANWVDKD
ncbi:mRNA splicing protein [Physocladia obscura]|uniref:Pre-mRNA-splicing factor SLU7 n=1 Tax=Physocladia obscura TaxID=109957 RepID=A0AAD5TAE8_9FUNG|nr:mRNA splicing protein [Physocladia obscura]